MINYLFIFLIILSGYNVDKHYFQQFKSKHNIRYNQLILLYFIDSHSCIGCLTPQNLSVDCIKEYIKKEKIENKLKIIAIVRIDRKIELKPTLKKFGWQDEYEIDYGDIKNKLGLENDVQICLLSPKYELFLSYTYSNRKIICNDLINKIKEIHLNEIDKKIKKKLNKKNTKNSDY